MLALGLWPGCVRRRNQGRGQAFTFVAINDAHFHSPRCPEWFERVSASIHSCSAKPEFCLMIGDLAEDGSAQELGAMREVLRSLRMDFYVVLGNHDYASDTDRSAWDALFPKSINYSFRHRGWQFVGLDSTQGTKWQNTNVPAHTIQWLRGELPRLDPAAPTVLFTHFPLAEDVPMRPANAEEVLEPLKPVNLVAVFNGHHHGFTQHTWGRTTLTTNRCCAVSRENHDGTREKGYFLCSAHEGTIHRRFIEVAVS